VETHRGSCHCGTVEFEVVTDLDQPFRCNCSFCVRRGAVLQRVPAGDFQVLTGESELTRYGARSFSDHFFCKSCGIQLFTRISAETGDSVAVNLACVDDVDVDSLEPAAFDGAKLL